MEEVTRRGDFIVGTLRKQEQIDAFSREFAGKASFVVMDLNKPEQIQAGVAKALKDHGRIDVLVNNAAYGLLGAVEEASDTEARHQMETNYFGQLAVMRAVLPSMRAQGSGYLVQISSVAGLLSSPGLGHYNASKFALEGISEALAREVNPLGIKVMIVEPGPFRTLWAGPSSKKVARKIPDYGSTAHTRVHDIQDSSGHQPGDPIKGVRLILKAMESANSPLRLPLGASAIERIEAKMQRFSQELAAWKKESLETAFTP